jgi:nitrile hydratase accessory protein
MTEMIGAVDRPPRTNGRLCCGEEWERTAFGVALALAKSGRFEWATFRQNLIDAIRGWESRHDLADPSWNYYARWLEVLERAAVESGLVTTAEIDRRLENLHPPGQLPKDQTAGRVATA